MCVCAWVCVCVCVRRRKKREETKVHTILCVVCIQNKAQRSEAIVSAIVEFDPALLLTINTIPKSETTLLALVGMSLAATFHVPADQLSAAWVTRNEPYAGAYWRLYRFFSGRLTSCKYVEEGTFALTDDQVKLHWVEKILALLGIDMSFKNAVSIDSDRLTSVSMCQFLRGDFKQNALRVFDNMRTRTFSRSALCDTPAQTKATIADALGVFGITLTAATTPKKSAAKSYTASWVWNQEPTAAPIVLHPLDVLKNKGLRPFHHRGPAPAYLGPAELVTATFGPNHERA